MLDSSMDVKSIQQWCLKQEVVRSNKGTVREYEMFKNIVASFMKEINELNEAPQFTILCSLQSWFTRMIRQRCPFQN